MKAACYGEKSQGYSVIQLIYTSVVYVEICNDQRIQTRLPFHHEGKQALAIHSPNSASNALKC